MMNVRELKEKLRGLDDDLLVVIEDTSPEDPDPFFAGLDKDSFTLKSTRVIELYPGANGLLLSADEAELNWCR